VYDNKKASTIKTGVVILLSIDKIKELKQTNVSVNADSTKQRVKDVLKTASKEQRTEIETLSGLKRSSIDRVYAKGAISAKIAIAIAQTLNINPAYLTGETDEQGECTDKALKAFLKAKVNANLKKVTARPSGRPPKKPAPPKAAAPAKPAENKPVRGDVNRPSFNMNEDEAIILLKSLFIQAKYSPASKNKLNQVKALLS
jgi:hypothetical protein